MKRYQKTKTSQFIVVGLIIIGVFIAGLIVSIVMDRIPFEDHFVIPWAAGRAWLLESKNPYESEIIQIAKNTILESTYLASLPDEDLFLLPVLNLIFYLPFSLIPYTISRIIWVTLTSFCILLIIYFSFSLSKWKISAAGMLFVEMLLMFLIPGLTTAVMGFLSPIIILLLILSIHLILSRQDTTAGFLLALTVGSLTVSGLVIVSILVYGLVKRRWSIISAFFSGVAFMLVVSILLLPSWPGDWIRILAGNFPNMDLIQTPLMTLAAYLPGVENFLSILMHAFFGVYFLVMMVVMRRKSDRIFIWSTLATLIIAFLVNMRGSIHFIFIIYPALFFVFRYLSERWGLFGKIFSWIILAVLGIGSWIFSFPIESIRPLGFPLITIGMPILVFLGMNWIRWWAIKIPNLQFESL